MSFLLKAKKIGHKYYSVKRRKLYIDSIDNIVYINNNNYEKYKSKILTFLQNNKINEFIRELFIKPSIIVSIFARSDLRTGNGYGYGSDKKPLLYGIGQLNDGFFDHFKTFPKIQKLFLDYLFHFGEIILAQTYTNTLNTSKNNDSNDTNENENKSNDTNPQEDVFLKKYLNFDGFATNDHFAK